MVADRKRTVTGGGYLYVVFLATPFLVFQLEHGLEAWNYYFLSLLSYKRESNFGDYVRFLQQGKMITDPGMWSRNA